MALPKSLSALQAELLEQRRRAVRASSERDTRDPPDALIAWTGVEAVLA